MISDKIKAVFDFIDYLHKNTAKFKGYLPNVEKAWELKFQMGELNEDRSFQERIKSDELNTEKKKHIDKVNKNVVDVITSKAMELQICYKQQQRRGDYSYEFNWGNSEIKELEKNADKNDLKTIKEYKYKYVHFRTETNSSFLKLEYLIRALDDYLFDLFRYFFHDAGKEFEPFIYKQPKLSSEEKAEIERGILSRNHTKPNIQNQGASTGEEIQKLPNYCDLGVKVVIERTIKKIGFDWFYEEKKFNSSSELEKHLKNKSLTTTTSIRQWLDGSFGGDPKKNLFEEKRVKNIVRYQEQKGQGIPDHVKEDYPNIFLLI